MTKAEKNCPISKLLNTKITSEAVLFSVYYSKGVTNAVTPFFYNLLETNAIFYANVLAIIF
jgi:hypothetical protein